MRRKPFGVWVILLDGQGWLYERFRFLAEALVTARTLRGTSPLFPQHHVWIAHVDQPSHQSNRSVQAHG